MPSYAAVQATVEVAKQVRGRRDAGLVNAVLRRLLTAAQPADGAGPEGLAVRHSHPTWLVTRWLARFGAERTEALLRHNNTRPPLVLQPARWSRERLEAALREASVAFEPVPGDLGITVQARRRVHDLPGYAEGGFIVQDPAQARLVAFAALPPGITVWDACAAPGGKAVALAPGRVIVASDWRRDRISRLRATLARAAPAVHLLLADARHPPVRRNRVDAVLIDAPCSATGTIARHPDARWRLSAERLRRLVARQTAILDGAAGAVRPGALLVYLTCSLEPEENEEQVNRFLERHPGFTREGHDLQLFPPESGTDGGYGARLRRAA